jgi:hypothetical protein
MELDRDDAADDGEIVIAPQAITQAHARVEQAVKSVLMKRKNRHHRTYPKRNKAV